MKTLFNLPYRLAAIDIDDTLVGEDKRISAENAAAVAALRECGVHVMLASGRSHENLLHFHRRLGLHGHIISAQGALARHAETGEVLHEGLISASDAVEAIGEGQARGFTVFVYGKGRIWADRASKWVDVHEEEIRHTEKVYVGELNSVAGEGLLKVIWAGEPEEISAIADFAVERFAGRLSATVTCPYYLEFNRAGIHKAAGLAAVAEAMGISRDEVLAFGDGNNDVEMLAWAGMGVAMDGGKEAAKRAARRVSPSGAGETALARAVHEILEEHRAA